MQPEEAASQIIDYEIIKEQFLTRLKALSCFEELSLKLDIIIDELFYTDVFLPLYDPNNKDADRDTKMHREMILNRLKGDKAN